MIDDNILNAFISMGIIVLVLVAILILVKRFARKNKMGGADFDFKVLARLPLQAKAQATVIKVRGRTLLLGLTEQNVSLLADITEEDNIVTNSDKLESIFPTSKSKMRESLARASKSNSDLPNNLSFKAFVKSAFSKS